MFWRGEWEAEMDHYLYFWKDFSPYSLFIRFLYCYLSCRYQLGKELCSSLLVTTKNQETFSLLFFFHSCIVSRQTLHLSMVSNCDWWTRSVIWSRSQLIRTPLQNSIQRLSCGHPQSIFLPFIGDKIHPWILRGLEGVSWALIFLVPLGFCES